MAADPQPMDTDDKKAVSSEDQQQHQSNEFNPDYLRFYYGRLFPFAEMHKWLSYGHDGKHPGCDGSFFGRREFSFTLENDIYLRYLSFRDASEMEAAFRDKCPHKIDIGAVYNVNPSKRTAYSSLGGDKVFSPVERELVFDVDMTDYDDIRTCCTGAGICLRCWPLMTIAIKVMDTSLREDFGFEHLLWVYSGRRGVHCWVSDSRARRLTNEQRASITDFFRVYKGSEMNGKKVSLTGPVLHPSLTRAYVDVLKQLFEEEILLTQSLLNPDEQYEKILDMVPDESIRAQLRDKWQDTKRYSSPDEINLGRWKQLKHLLESGKQKGFALRRCVEEIVFSHTYPRLDLEVSKSMNHLLKSPFCIHPKTGRVCVPVDPNTCESFNPLEVPTVSQLLNELNGEEKQSRGSESSPVFKDWERTSLAKSIQYFRSSFLEPLLRASKAELESAYKEKLHEAATASSLNWRLGKKTSKWDVAEEGKYLAGFDKSCDYILQGFALRRCVEEIVFSHTYPRLDLEVSKSINHLLKSPFCIHPKTGRVCVPVDPNTCESFNPLEVPTVSQLLNELNGEEKQSRGSESSPVFKDWERTSLAKSVQYFRSSFLEPLLRASKAELESAYKEKLHEAATASSLNW